LKGTQCPSKRTQKIAAMELEMLQKHTKLAMWPKMAKIQLNRPKMYKEFKNELKGCLGRGKSALIYFSKGLTPPL